MKAELEAQWHSPIHGPEVRPSYTANIYRWSIGVWLKTSVPRPRWLRRTVDGKLLSNPLTCTQAAQHETLGKL